MENVVQTPSTAQAIDNDDVAVPDDAGGVLLLEENKWRVSALITNTGSNPMRVTTDGSAPTATHGKQVVPGASLVLASPNCPTGAVRGIAQGAGADTVANASEVTS